MADTTANDALTDNDLGTSDALSPSAAYDSSSKPLSYGADLWDRFHEVCQKLSIGKDSIKDIQKYLQSIAELHEKLGKQLQKTTFADQNLGELGGPIKTLMNYSREIGNTHVNTASSMINMLLKDLTAMRTEVSKSVKKAIEDEKKLKSDALKALKDSQAAKTKDSEKKREFENLQITLFKSGDLPPKKLQDLQSKCHNAEKIASKMEAEYREAVTKANQAREAFLSGTSKMLMQLEDLDKKRIRLVKSVLERFMQLHETITQTTQKGCSTMASSFELIDANKDIQSFIMASKTNEIPAPPEEFTPYIVKIPDEAQASRFSVALSPSTMSAAMGGMGATSSNNNNNNNSSNSNNGSATTGVSGVAGSRSTVGSSGFNSAGAAGSPSTAASASGGTSNTNGSSSSSMSMLVVVRPVLKRVRALYVYAPEPTSDAEELPLAAGQEVDVLEMNDDGWWVGRDKNGKTGFFPSNYVEVVPDSAVPLASARKGSQGGGASSEQRGIERRSALYEYAAADPSELSFKAGDIISVIEKTEDGWWVGQLAGRQGLFPHNYTELAK